jgi:hypothetical protein
MTDHEANLGLATTEELFREIITRFAMLGRYPGPVERALVLAEMLGGLSATDREYRTVDEPPIDPGPHEPLTLDNIERRLVNVLLELLDDYGPAGVRETINMIVKDRP